MTKNNYRRQSDNIKNIDIVEEFEDFGYDIQNAKRYTSRSKRQSKFKDYDEHDEYWWIGRQLGKWHNDACFPFLFCYC